jgi:hypothetical protein
LNTEKPVHLEITLKRGVWTDPSKFIQQIAGAGYAARKSEVRITLTGMISKEGDRIVLTANDLKPGPPKFELVQAKGSGEKEARTWSEALQAAGEMSGKTVEVEGFWTPPDTKKNKDALQKLAVIRIISLTKEEPGK